MGRRENLENSISTVYTVQYIQIILYTTQLVYFIHSSENSMLNKFNVYYNSKKKHFDNFRDKHHYH